MAGMISASFSPIRLSYRHQRSSLHSLFCPQQVNALNHLLIGRNRSHCPLTLVASSVQPSKTVAPAQFNNTLPSKEVLEIWCNVNAVCFDVDSTVCLDEGIDELADFCGAGKAVAEWTSRAMAGSVPFEEALAARLSLFNPSLSQLHDFLKKKPPRISPGINELIKKLKSRKTDVYLVSGGFRQMIEPVAVHLGIPHENIFANQLLFGGYGEFLGFDTNEPTSRSGGKATAVQHIRKVHEYNTLVMIGDGATDLEARKPGGADLFICYAGVQLREAVAEKADWLLFNFENLCAVLR
uniref:phosphoserine phosphatase n=1 Tax=Anthurium amnicola TaxID=1678845 RepID=A0A1D1YVD3_9ARAE